MLPLFVNKVTFPGVNLGKVTKAVPENEANVC